MKSKKNVVIVSNFYLESENNRGFLAYKYFQELGYKVKVYTANFDHYAKEEIKDKKDYIIYIDTIHYRKNISLKRIFSHFLFSIKVLELLKKEEKFDILYVNVPPNILGYFLSRKYKNKVIITDIIDLWPEALPFPKYIKKSLFIFFKFWKHLRNISLKNSTYILTHTYDFYNKLKLCNYKNSKVIYLKKYNHKFMSLKFSKNEIRILYLGNISYIYDFDSLIEICKKLKSFYKKVIVEIIGDGPLKQQVFEKLKSEKINYLYHGIIFQERLKEKIVSRCQFGYNGYKNDTDVSLSYKSIDYFSYGLPIINSAKGDTWEIIKKEKNGYNFKKIYLNEILENLSKLDEKKYELMSNRSKKVFEKYFSYKSYKKEFDIILGEINE